MVLHPLQKYAPSIEPVPHSWVCKLCHKDFGSSNPYDDHICKCWKQHVQKQVTAASDSLVEQKRQIPCDWMVNMNGTRCLKVFSDNDKYRRHVLQHSWNQLGTVTV